MRDIAASTTRSLLTRVGPFLALVIFLNTLDRVNISFAALSMNQEIGLTPTSYGFGVGLFFVSYMLFQIPVISVVERIGLVRSIGTMAIGWGVVSATMGLVQGRTSFYILRFCLGMVEAGVSPALILYASRWGPSVLSARLLGQTALALPASFVFGAPLSGLIMKAAPIAGGLSSWRWMLLVEGIPPIVTGIIAFFWLEETPENSKRLTRPQRQWLIDALARDAALVTHQVSLSWSGRLKNTLRDPRVWIVSAVMFCISLGFFGFLYWLPQMIKAVASGVSTLNILLISALPWVSAAFGMIVLTGSSDRRKERHIHMASAAFIAAIGLWLEIFASSPVIKFTALMIAGFGVGGAQGLFFSIPVQVLRGSTHLGMALAVITAMGSAAGLVGANAIGLLNSLTGSFESAIFLISLTYIIGGLVAMWQGRQWRLQTPSADQRYVNETDASSVN